MANTYTFTSFSGADMRASAGGLELGTLTGLSFSITREKGPVYVAGNPNPIGVGRGRRGIAGSLTFATLNKAALAELMGSSQFARKPGEPSGASTSEVVESIRINDSTAGAVAGAPMYVDQLPPFNISISFVNEAGSAAHMELFGVDILSEGGGFSIEELTLETQMTFIALSLQRMDPRTSISLG